MFGLYFALSTPGGSEKRISIALSLGLCPAGMETDRKPETNLRMDRRLEDVGRSSLGPCAWFLRNLDSYYKATSPIVHIPPPNRLIQHRIRKDGQWLVRSFKAYLSP